MKKVIIRIVSVLVFCALLIFCGKVLRYLVTDDISSYTRIMIHEMYEQDNIDVLFVGSSHCYRSFVPEILDEELGVNTFNAGTSSQAMDGSFMLIKEAARYHDIQHVYLEVYYNGMFEVYKERTQMTPTYIISDYLRPSIDKFLYLLNASGKEQYVHSFIVARRNWSGLYWPDFIKEMITQKSTEAYRTYDYSNVTSEEEWYVGKGYVAGQGAVDNWNYFSTRGWEPVNFENVSQDWLDSLTDIMDFCERKGIELTLVSAPMSDFLVTGTGGYDEYIEMINDIIGDREVEYYDFNLCREEYFPSTSELFKDVDHLNQYGAEVFSRSFAKLVNGEVSPEEMFYGTYEEKLENLGTAVFGISYYDDTSEDGTAVRQCKIISSGIPGMEYQVQMEPEEGETYMIQEFSENSYFEIDPEISGTCRVTYRVADEPEDVSEVRVTIQ